MLIDATPVLHALIDMGVTRTQIARALKCDVQTVQCWLNGMPMNLQRREEWVLGLIDFAMATSMPNGHAYKSFSEMTESAAAVARGVFQMLAEVQATREPAP